MWHLKPQKFIADDQMLLEKGFADELHLKPVYPMLKSGDIKANKNYGWDHPSFKRVFDEFYADIRPGRLMMVATTPRVNAGDNTVFHQAEMTLADRCPDAACLVVHGGGINLLYRNADDPEAAHGYGVHLKKVRDKHDLCSMSSGTRVKQAHQPCALCRTLMSRRSAQLSPSSTPVGGSRFPLSCLDTTVWVGPSLYVRTSVSSHTSSWPCRVANPPQVRSSFRMLSH